MIRAYLYKKENYYCGFCIKGHAGYADYGNDIVCSAVSTLTSFSAELILQCDSSSTFVSDDKTAEATLRSTSQEEMVQLVYKQLYKDLTDISQAYSGTLSIILKEE